VKLAPSPRPKTLDAAPKPSVEEAAATKQYTRAFNAYRQGTYGKAILDFEEFLRLYPDHPHADNARYWIGESFYSQGEYKQAVVEFNRVFDRYPHEDKAPDALLKIGHSYEKLGDGKNARVFWRRVANLYPESEAARRAQEALGVER
jgi:tol-pal system protein YbgF